MNYYPDVYDLPYDSDDNGIYVDNSEPYDDHSNFYTYIGDDGFIDLDEDPDIY